MSRPRRFRFACCRSPVRHTARPLVPAGPEPHEPRPRHPSRTNVADGAAWRPARWTPHPVADHHVRLPEGQQKRFCSGGPVFQPVADHRTNRVCRRLAGPESLLQTTGFFRYRYPPKQDVSKSPDWPDARSGNHPPEAHNRDASLQQTSPDHCQKKTSQQDQPRTDPDLWEFLFPLSHVVQQIKRA